MSGPRLRFVRPDEPAHPMRAANAAMPAPAGPPVPRGLVAHAAWLPGPTGAEPQLLIWAEIDTAAVDVSASRRATVPYPYLNPQPHAQPHPACVRGNALAGMLERLWKTSRPGVRPRSKCAQSTLAVWLPSWNGRPLPSSELVRAGWAPDPALQGVDASRASLRLWHVHALALDAESAGTLLAGLPHLRGAEASAEGAMATTSRNGRASTPRLLLGSDLRLWSAAARFALDLLVRQRYVPSCLALPAEQVYSSWREMEVVLGRWSASLADPADRARFEALAAAMPDLCRAAATSARAADPEHAPDARDLLQAFVDGVVHARVAYWVRQDGLLPTISASAYDAYDRYRFGPSYYGFGPSGSLTERWMWSLLRPEEAMYLSPPVAATLVEGVRRWHGGLQGTGSGAFRLCLRLCPPEIEPERAPDASAAETAETAETAEMAETLEDGGVWRLEYLLQARDDPSLLVPLDQVWRARGSVAGFLDRRFDHPREQALTALTQAGRLFPPVAASLSEAHPLGCDLTGREAYSFLVEALPLLEEAGFGVLAPAWWKRATARPSLRLQLRKPQKTSTGLMGLEAVLSYDWKLALGGQELEREELERLVELKQPLVRVRGQWMELRQEQVQAALAFVRAHPGGRMSLGDALRVSLTGEAAGGEVDVEEVRTDEWIGELFGRLRGGEAMEEMPQPEALCGVLRPYQLRGLSWLAFLTRHGLGACLADDMGLGKTVQLLALMLHQKAQGQLAKPVLLVCPTSVVGNWVHEVARFAPDLRVLVHHGAERIGRSAAASLAAEAAAYDLVITTYSLLPRDEAALGGVEWGGVVLDEAQNIKNAEAKQSRAARNLKAPMRVVLTGTPVENRLSELWSIMDFLNPAYLGSHRRFHEHFAVPIEKLRDRQATSRLQALVRPFILRRLKTDPTVISDLPEKLEMREYCPLTREQVTLYEAVVREGLAQIEQSAGDMERRGIVLAMLTRLKQVCNHPAHFLADDSDLAGRSGKLARLEELIEELLAEGDRALLFTQFAAMGELLQPYLQERFGREVLYLHGGVPRQQRERMIARFQSDDGPPIFLLSLKAGGTGLNLTRANHVIHFDRWWNPAVENQATDRAFRIGQTRNVQVRKFVCTGTLEERIDAMIEQKRELAEVVIGTGEGWITEMSTEQLRELLSLRADALAD